MKKIIIILAAVLVLLSGCYYKYTVSADQPDTEILIDGQEYQRGTEYKSRRNFIHVQADKEGFEDINIQVSAQSRSKVNATLLELKALQVQVKLSSLYNCYPAGELAGKQKAILIDGQAAKVKKYTVQERKRPANDLFIGEGLRFEGTLSWGRHEVTFQADGYPDYRFPLVVCREMDIRVRHPMNLPEPGFKLRPLGVYDCGFQPKQINISPDNKFLYIALLDGKGFQIFDMEKMAINSLLEPAPDINRKGFVEGLFIPGHSAYFVSQMSTGKIYEYETADYKNPVFRRSVSADGIWSKVIDYSKTKDILAVSNWDSYDVTIIDYASGKILKKLADLKEPRGLWFSSDGKSLYVTAFLGGRVFRYNTETWKREAEFSVKYSAMRHIRAAADEKSIYVSDMRWNKVYELAGDTLKLIRTYEVSTNPNTIETGKDGKYLFVSTRGQNNPVSYLRRSLEPGEVNIIDLKKHEIVSAFTAGTQPTGLDVASDNSFFAVSNFQDHTIEIFAIEN